MANGQPTRRIFLKCAALAGSAAVSDWSKLLEISPACAAEANVTPQLVRFTPDLEPIVRLIEQTKRLDCPAMMLKQLQDGLPYRIFLAALFLANLRTGIVDHPLAALHSTNQLTLDLPVQERLLPMFWALDAYKAQQAQPALQPLRGPIPVDERAEEEFHRAMKAYDSDKAERAIISLARTRGAYATIEPIWRYAARDWTFIGHLSIWAANTWRVLQTVGWQHAESALRVTVRNIMGDPAGMRGQPYEENLLRVARISSKLPANWAESIGNTIFTTDLLSRIRARHMTEACQMAAEALASGSAQAGAVWDAVHLAGAEMLLCCQKNSEPLHANTVANALHYSFQVSISAETRLLILLQAVGWMILFRTNMSNKGWLVDAKRIDDLAGEQIVDDPVKAVGEILSEASYGPGGKPTDNPAPGWKGPSYNNQPWRFAAAKRAFTFATKFPGSRLLQKESSRLLPLKADWDPHRIKFPIAAFENITWVSSHWIPHMTAAASYSCLGADALDTPLATQVREAVARL